MEKGFDIVAIGEVLIDFTDAGMSKDGMQLFEQNPGGAPANMLTVASHMGLKTALVGKIGNDMHGMFLKETLEKEKICTDCLRIDEDTFTTLAFVKINKNGEREFSFARKPGADTQLKPEEVDLEILKKCKIFHTGSLSMTTEPVRTTTIHAVEAAKAAGSIISYDPNYRASLWEDEKAAVHAIKSLIPYTDVMKVSDEEGFLITGEQDYRKAAEKLLEKGPYLVAVTLGAKGVYLAQKGKNEYIEGYRVTAVDTTGAGDSFWGGFLSHFLTYGKSLMDMKWEEWKECAKYGNATASLCVQKRGGIPSIPQKEEVIAVVKKG